MDDSNLQTLSSGYFSHLQIIKITRILRVESVNFEHWFKTTSPPQQEKFL